MIWGRRYPITARSHVWPIADRRHGLGGAIDLNTLPTATVEASKQLGDGSIQLRITIDSLCAQSECAVYKPAFIGASCAFDAARLQYDGDRDERRSDLTVIDESSARSQSDMGF